jgi:hypothetical protein
MFRIALLAAVAFLALIGSANATTYVVTLNWDSAANVWAPSVSASTGTLSNNVALSPTAHTGTWGITNTSVDSQYLAPVGITANNGDYLYVGGGTNASATYDLSTKGFGLTWGSIDSYNMLTLNFAGKSRPAYEISGTALWTLLTPYVGDLTANGGSNGSTNYGYQADVFFQTQTSDIKSAVLTSGTAAFEVANISTSLVPLPSAALLFGSGLMGLAGFSKRKKTKNQA